MLCDPANKWIDVFVTKGDEQLENVHDAAKDEFVCSVCSVDLGYTADNRLCASVVAGETQFLMPTWAMQYDLPYCKLDPNDPSKTKQACWDNVEAGDVIRIGNFATDGFTEYLTVV